jgi:hypothetical protein
MSLALQAQSHAPDRAHVEPVGECQAGGLRLALVGIHTMEWAQAVQALEVLAPIR